MVELVVGGHVRRLPDVVENQVDRVADHHPGEK
jgi:hypothetical protein